VFLADQDPIRSITLLTCFWILTIAPTLQRVAQYISAFVGGDENLWAYAQYKILMSSDTTIFSVIAVVLGTVLVFWIRKSL